MKQVLQSIKSGETHLAEIPIPKCQNGQLLIQTSKTLVSSGTERMLVEFGKAGLLGKARQQPEKLKDVFDKIKTDGLYPTLEAVLNKLGQPLPLGYCNVGHVVELGGSVRSFDVGDRVISNGRHAEVISAPVNLCAKVPSSVSDEEAAFAVLASIALQGVRLIKPTLGETVVVTGLGLVGLLTVQILRANGCRVLGLDYMAEKLELARAFGAEVVDLSVNQDPISIAHTFSRNRGVDAVIITAATQSSRPMHQAANMCRQRGRIVLVGVTGLDLSREDFFKKELQFQVSASYGPGRYDTNYEEKGHDYPVGFVRWTEQRNFEAVLDMMAAGTLNVKPLISHKFPILDAIQAYHLISGTEQSMGILLEYPGIVINDEARTVNLPKSCPNFVTDKKIKIKSSSRRVKVSFIGCGNYASSILIPAFKSAGAFMLTAASVAGVTGMHAAQKFKFVNTTTDINGLFENPNVDAVVISTRHDSHAGFIKKGISYDKSIFVEKPLCISLDELKSIEETYRKFKNQASNNSILMVGFNRRFAPHIQKIKQLLITTTSPKSFVYTVNAGQVPSDHWTQDNQVGGGRIVGECCHFIDLICFLADNSLTFWDKNAMSSQDGDTVTINLKFCDGSIGTIHYFANGSKAFPKERLEIFSDGRVLQLDNFRKLRGYNWPGFKKMDLWRQDKGHKACARAFVSAVAEGSKSPIPSEQLFEVAKTTILLTESP